MADSRDLQLSSYDYVLPEDRIAQAPVEPRHDARLLVVPPAECSLSELRHQRVWDWQQELEEWDEGLQELEQTEAGRIRMGGGVGEQSDIGDDLLRR